MASDPHQHLHALINLRIT